MTFDQAKKLREDLAHMIGMRHNELTIRDVVVTPSDVEEFKNWGTSYHFSQDVYGSILPYLNSDLMVEFVYLMNGQGYEHNGYFVHGNVLVEAPERFGVEIDIEKYGLKKKEK